MTGWGRRAVGRAAPLVVGALVLGIAVARPAPAAPGSVLTGPEPPHSLVLPRLGTDYRVAWADDHRVIRLEVRDGARCRPPLPVETSTAPARIEVVVPRPTGAACAAAPRWWRYDLALPAVAEPGQLVTVWVNGRTGSVPRYPRSTGHLASTS